MYEILIKSNPEPIFIYDEENLRFLEVNDAALTLYGYTKDEFLQMDLTDLYSPEDIQNLLETSEEILKEGEFSKPYRHRKKDGTFIYVRISKIKFKYEEKDSVFNIVKDVTGLFELEKNNQLYKTIFDNTSDLVFVTDASGIITFINDVVPAKLGISRNELLKSSLTSLCEGEDRALINNAIFQSHTKEPVTISVQLRTSGGNFIGAEVTANPILNVSSDIEAFSIIARAQLQESKVDKKPKEIIKEVVKEVFVEKSAEEKGGETKIDTSFISGVFHEILTPMNVILGFAQELSESIDNLSPEQQEAVDIINQNRNSLLGIMNSIIEFSDIQRKTTDLQIEELGITEIVESLDKNIKNVTGLSDVEFAYGRISSSLKFETDRKAFESIVNNLIRMVSKISDKKKIYFSAYPVDKEIFNINVSDSFARPSETLLEKLSQLFIENKEPKEVGISKLNFQMINSLLKILNGKFTVTSDTNGQKDSAFSFPIMHTEKMVSEVVEEEDEAAPDIVDQESPIETVEETDFDTESIDEKFELPPVSDDVLSRKEPEPFFEKEEIEIEEEIVDSEEQVPEEKVKPSVDKQETASEQKIVDTVPEAEITPEVTAPVNENDYLSRLSCLYIEDQVDSQILFKVQMKGLKSIQFAASFEEAIPLLEANKFDFIVMDINLQGEYNGLDALKAIHQMQGFENIPIIAVTAYVLPGDREKFIATGFNDFISKPIFREKMYESLKKIFIN